MDLKVYKLSELAKSSLEERVSKDEESTNDRKVMERPTGNRKGNKQQVDYLLEEMEKILKIPSSERKVNLLNFVQKKFYFFIFRFFFSILCCLIVKLRFITLTCNFFLISL